MLVDQQIKIYYINKNWPFEWKDVVGDEREKAKTADIIITQDGKVIKERFAGYNYITNNN